MGFFNSLYQNELLVYLLFILVSDRNGLSFYSYDKLCSFLQMNLDDYLKQENN